MRKLLVQLAVKQKVVIVEIHISKSLISRNVADKPKIVEDILLLSKQKQLFKRLNGILQSSFGAVASTQERDVS